MHALILIFCRLHTIDTELTQCMQFYGTYIQVIESQVTRCNFQPRLLDAAMRKREKKNKRKSSRHSLRIYFRLHRDVIGTELLVTLIVANDVKKLLFVIASPLRRSMRIGCLINRAEDGALRSTVSQETGHM